MVNFNSNNVQGNSRRAGKAISDAIRTPELMARLSADEVDFMHHLRDVMMEIFNRERISNE